MMDADVEGHQFDMGLHQRKHLQPRHVTLIELKEFLDAVVT